MKSVICAIAVFCYLPMGCTTLSDQAKMEQYGRTLDSYEAAMRMSAFDAICQFVDPLAMPRQDCVKHFGNIKIVDYKVTHINLSEDHMNVHHEIEVGYYFLDHYVLKKIQYKQSWAYQKERNIWLLQNGPPLFE